MEQEIIAKYKIEEIEGNCLGKPIIAYRVKNKYAIKAYLNNDFDWYAKFFINSCNEDGRYKSPSTLAERFIDGFIAEEFVMSYLKDIDLTNYLNTWKEYSAKLTWQDQNSRYSYSKYAIQNRTLTKPDYYVKCDTRNPRPFAWNKHVKFWADCKYCSGGKLTTSQAQKSHDANYIIALCKTDTGYIIRFYRYHHWDDMQDVTGDTVNIYHQNKNKEWKFTGVYEELANIDVTTEFNNFLEKYKNIR